MGESVKNDLTEEMALNKQLVFYKANRNEIDICCKEVYEWCTITILLPVSILKQL